MKKIYIIVFVVIFTFCSSFSLNFLLNNGKIAISNQVKSKYTVVIDAGHGGKDAGTIASDGTLEKGINLAISKDLYEFLIVSGISAMMTRYDDYLVYDDNDDLSKSDLYNRMDIVNSVDNSCLISIHQNHFENEAEWGMQVFYSGNNEESKLLADNIQNITTSFYQKDNSRLTKLSDSSLYLLYKAKVPSVLVECGFMSNYDENNKLKDEKYQENLAYSIMLGFLEFSGEDNYG